MSGTLYVVATPIGNLEDITLRALRILREVNLVAAEDTRRTAKLLSYFAIPARTISFHEHNTKSRVTELMERLRSGESVALVTDAGTPGVSDPGLELVQAAIDRGITVDPIPGASAPLAALVASGFSVVPFTVFGFPPTKSKARIAWFVEVSKLEHTFSFFEAPHRIHAALAEAADVFGERPMCVGRELTKIHQEFMRGTAAALSGALTTPKGELTVVVGPAIKDLEPEDLHVSDEELVREFCHITETGSGSRRDIVKQLAKRSRRSARDIYAAIERAKKLGNQP